MPADAAGWELRVVQAGQTAELRRAVLRPGGAAMPGDDDPTAVHVAAYAPSGDMVACGNVRQDPTRKVWRIRGMATAEAARGQGAGTAVLAALIGHGRSGGARLVWCNARLPAQRLYERAGLTTWGESWQDPDLGPHIVMWRTL